MIQHITHAALKSPGLVLLSVAAIVAIGVGQLSRMPVDAFPDISPVMVPVFAEGHGMAPEEIERLITYPIESAMNGLPDVTRMTSTSAFGMSVVYVYFRDDVDIYFARQLVAQRLSGVLAELPDLDEPPKLGPISTGLGQIFLYYLAADPQQVDTQGKDLNTWLREYNDWVIKFQLQTVPGVTDILSIGGHVLQYQIRVDPNALVKFDLSLDDLVTAVQKNNRNVGGHFLVLDGQEFLVRGVGLVECLDDLRRIAIKQDAGSPIFLEDVAAVSFGNAIRRGVVTHNGEREVVSGMVLKLYGENTSRVIAGLYEKVAQIQQTLPDGVTLVPYYEQAELVQRATWTVEKALLIGGFLVLMTLAVFLGNWRTALIVALSLPICALLAIIFMGTRGLSANLMSLGGIAIAVGMLCDGAIVMVENVFRHLGEPEAADRPKIQTVLRAAREVNGPIFFSIAMIIIVFLPLFSLQGVEGKMFSPMAFTISFALLGSLIVALVVIPPLCLICLPARPYPDRGLTRLLAAWYQPLLIAALRHTKSVLAAAGLAFLASLAVLTRLGTEFMPKLEEGDLLIGVTMAPSISLEQGTRLILDMEREILAFPPVQETVSRVGRPETGSHPHPVNYAEIHVSLKPSSQWRAFRSKPALVDALNATLKTYPGVQLNFTQPIQNAFDELLSGIKAELAITLFGEDLSVLRTKAMEIQAAIEEVPGLVDLSVEQNFGQPQIQIAADRDACARLGVSISDVMEIVERAVGGEVIDDMVLDTRRFGIHLRFQEAYRSDPDAIGSILLSGRDGRLIPLSQLARIQRVTGPIQINRENNQRRWVVQGNVRGRDLGSVVADIRSRVADRVVLPSGITLEFGGQFKNQERAMTRLAIIVPVVLSLVLLLLWIPLGTVRHALIIALNVPLALIGGILGLWLTGEYLSVPASVGFIALFGIAMQNGLVLVTYFNDLLRLGHGPTEAVLQGARLRLRPVLMTATTTVLGLLPLLLAQGIGADVQRPLATVVVFGLCSSTALTLFVIPVAYTWIEERRSLRG